MRSQQMFLRLMFLSAATAIIALVAPGCSSRTDQTSVDSIIGSGSTMYQYQTSEDARTFTDTWVHAVVISEKIGHLEGGAKNEGYRDRIVQLKVVETYWIRPFSKGVKLFELHTGIIVKDGQEFPLRLEGAQPLIVGSNYLIGLIYRFDGINIPDPHAVLPLINGRVKSNESSNVTNPVFLLMVDRTPEDAVALVSSAQPLIADSITDPEERLLEARAAQTRALQAQ